MPGYLQSDFHYLFYTFNSTPALEASMLYGGPGSIRVFRDSCDTWPSSYHRKLIKKVSHGYQAQSYIGMTFFILSRFQPSSRVSGTKMHQPPVASHILFICLSKATGMEAISID